MTLAINVLKGQGPGTAVGKKDGKTRGTGKLLCGQQGIVPGGSQSVIARACSLCLLRGSWRQRVDPG